MQGRCKKGVDVAWGKKPKLQFGFKDRARTLMNRGPYGGDTLIFLGNLGKGGLMIHSKTDGIAGRTGGRLDGGE